MADYLAEEHVPIDYQRRRYLDYTTLLPDKVWAQISRDTATPGPRSTRSRIARCFLFEQISGLPGTQCPSALDDSMFRTKVANFPQHLTPALARALDEHAGEFLAERGINDEPATWRPPAGILDGMLLPGADPEAVDVNTLHQMIAAGEKRLGVVATQIGTSLDTVRYLLEVHPTPRPAPIQGTETPPNHNRAYRTAKSALPRDRLIDLYEHQRMSLQDIADTVGVSRNTIASLARDYDVPLRQSGRSAGTSVDRDWLYDQYVNKRRALPDIASEACMSTANMAVWAKMHAIPMRGRGGPSHSASLAAHIAASEAPALIRPALAGIGGWERLRRFAAAARYPTLTSAAEELGVHQFSLVNQINRIERELGMKLLVRAARGYPMELTDDGARVVATIRACQRKGRS